MRADIHTHFIPPGFLEQVRAGRGLDGIRVEQVDGAEWVAHPQGFRYPAHPTFYDLEAKLAHMDGLGIDVSVLSIAPTLFLYWLEDVAAAADFARQANEAMADFARRSGGRLYAMATVPLQDAEAAATELRHAVRELGHRGALIGTTMEDVPLDDPRLEPFFAEAEALGVPVVLHPYYVGSRPQFADFYMTNLIGNPLETCVAATRMIFSGFLDRHPSLEVVLVHAGGFLPYQIGRLDHGYAVRQETRGAIQQPPSAYLRRFHYDTITHAARPLAFLVDLVGADRVVLGTDIPFDMADERFGEHLAMLEGEARAMVEGGNAARLFGLEIHEAAGT